MLFLLNPRIPVPFFFFRRDPSVFLLPTDRTALSTVEAALPLSPPGRCVPEVCVRPRLFLFSFSYFLPPSWSKETQAFFNLTLPFVFLSRRVERLFFEGGEGGGALPPFLQAATLLPVTPFCDVPCSSPSPVLFSIFPPQNRVPSRAVSVSFLCGPLFFCRGSDSPPTMNQGLQRMDLPSLGFGVRTLLAPLTLTDLPPSAVLNEYPFFVPHSFSPMSTPAQQRAFFPD